MRHTHKLETVEGGTCQDTERNRASKVHSRSGDGRGRDLSGHEKEPTKRGTLTSWRRQRGRLSGHGKEPSERGSLTSWRRWREVLVRTRKEIDRARYTDRLGTAEGGTCQDTEWNRPRRTHFLEMAKGRDSSGCAKNRASQAHSLPGDGRGRDLSGRGKKPSERGILTSWRWQRKRLVRTRKEPSERGRLTSWTHQREELVRTQKETNRGTLTNWGG